MGLLNVGGRSVFTDGARLVKKSFVNWVKKNRGKRACTLLTSKGRWRTEKCSKKFRFFCKRQRNGEWLSFASRLS